MTEVDEDVRVVDSLHEALDRASDLALQLAALTGRVQDAARDVARALVDVMDRAEKNSAS